MICPAVAIDERGNWNVVLKQVTRYTPSRNYLLGGGVAGLLALLCVPIAFQFAPVIVLTVLLSLASGVLCFLACRPVVELHPHHLRIGERVLPWPEILRVDRTGWISPLVVHLALADGGKIMLIYPGDYESSNQLLRGLRRGAANALIDGVPHHQFWSDPVVAVAAEEEEPSSRPVPPARRYPLLRPEDEADIERLYQRLKAVGRLDPKDE